MNNVITSMLDFFSSETVLNIIYIGIIGYVGILWGALVAWVSRDIGSRTKSFGLKTLSILLAVGLNVFGLLIYMLIRPKKTINERLFEKLELQTFMEELQKTRETSHKNVKAPVEKIAPVTQKKVIKNIIKKQKTTR